ncbi:SCO family protein [Neisseria weaveri]|uniref:Lipoprotein n=1 Tax=Neisseria weaveri TaxID=28091 RepID=A0A3S5C9M0_9NEIS|nr:SCO family protein [Neisseria weaveri]EGV35365.1 lipoprotein [Neisseria weaveri LMG 5135]EGV35900.1 lipoprotein [Neisseria weaveri ATCC 51223]VEJ49916.1 lipoprotein [Neisseria weaveri]
MAQLKGLSRFFLSTAALLVLAACQPEKQEAPAAPAAEKTAVSESSSTVKQTLNGTDVSKDDIGGDFTLTDGNGQPFSLSSLNGKAVILSFGYTHCPDVCPTELLTYSDVLKHLGDEAKNVAVVFVSVDPERDTPELIGKYVKQFHPDFIGLTATEGQSLPIVKQQYRVVSAKTNEQSEKVYLVDHSAGAYLLDKAGNPAVFSPYGSTAEQIAQDLKVLLQR